MRFGMRIAVGILEKSRRLRTARFSLGIQYSSGPGARGKEERPSGSCGAPVLLGGATFVLAPPRSERGLRFDYGCTKIRVQCRFFLARNRATGLRFRFAKPFLGRIETLPQRQPVCLPVNDHRGERSWMAEGRERRRREASGKAQNARGDSKSHERHNRIVHCLMTGCSIPAAAKPESAPPDCCSAS